MKLCKTLFAALLLFSFFSVEAQDQGEMMKKWQENMTPGPVHQMLAKMVGNWNAEITNYTGGQETKAQGTATYEMILGGRYLKSSFKSSIMGMEMEGMGLDAYDNASKEFSSVWVDNISTGLTYLKGTMDEKSKTITYFGNSVDSMTGKEVKSKTINTLVDDNKSVFDMYNVVDGQDVKVMTIVYTRAK